MAYTCIAIPYLLTHLSHSDIWYVITIIIIIIMIIINITK